METKLKSTCTLIHTGETYTGKQALTHFAGISAENSGAQGICLLLTTIPPGGRAKPIFTKTTKRPFMSLAGRLGCGMVRT